MHKSTGSKSECQTTCHRFRGTPRWQALQQENGTGKVGIQCTQLYANDSPLERGTSNRNTTLAPICRGKTAAEHIVQNCLVFGSGFEEVFACLNLVAKLLAGKVPPLLLATTSCGSGEPTIADEISQN